MMTHDIDTPTARELEVMVRRLWTTEPLASPAERTRLFIELGFIGLALERIILRDEMRTPARPATEDLRSDLAECERRVENVLARWPSDVGVRSPLLVAA